MNLNSKDYSGLPLEFIGSGLLSVASIGVEMLHKYQIISVAGDTRTYFVMDL
jgi:hypothetical protein